MTGESPSQIGRLYDHAGRGRLCGQAWRTARFAHSVAMLQIAFAHADPWTRTQPAHRPRDQSTHRRWPRRNQGETHATPEEKTTEPVAGFSSDK